MDVKTVYGHFLNMLIRSVGIDQAKKFDTWFRFHRKLDLKSPKTLADKVTYIELHEPSPLAPMCTDKYAVRDYVASKGYAHALIPLAGGAWSDADEIDFNMLPESFILKATHGCKMNYPVSDKSCLDIENCKKILHRWLDTTYGVYSMEPHYKNIPHRIYAEKLMGGGTADIKDYKFHCLNGVPQFVLVCSERKVIEGKGMQVKLDLFDMDWHSVKALKVSGKEVPGDGNIPCPESFNEMKRMAKCLSGDFKFVRVDLYEIDGKAYFGELTFSPACCVFPYMTTPFLEEMGVLLKL